MEWLPIETAPIRVRMFVVKGFDVPVGKSNTLYTTDPYCVWQMKKGVFTRWPHDFQPTHWADLPADPKE